MAFVALVTLLALGLYMALFANAGRLRGKAHIAAPAVTGDAAFECALRIQTNTVEQLILFLPSLWLAGFFASWGWAGAIGLVWVAGRAFYAWSYQRAPASRGPGFLIGLVCASLLWLIALIGVLMNL
jgi:glutathione S-transferase